MSKQRKEILPGAEIIDSFFDKDVQKVLMTRFTPWPSLDELPDAKQEFLAWPLIAYHITDELAKDRDTKVSRHTDFLEAYAIDRFFISKLLSVITKYHHLPENEKSLRRRVSDLSSAEKGAPNFRVIDFNYIPSFDEVFPQSAKNNVPLEEWKTIAEALDCQNSLEQLATELWRERKHRKKIEKKWSRHHIAYFEICHEAHKGKRAILPELLAF